MGKGKLLIQKAAPGSGAWDVYVDPAALQTVAKVFATAAEAILRRQATFTAGSQLPTYAFGELSEGTATYQRYESARSSALQGLANLHNALQAVADGLNQSASNYLNADQASVVH
ncbi:MAG TPA: type VII secretion target [Candidatus Dormibacteraeota bacterium]|nr:type VII secretion target [Candidatus Dormibacteraeota bacterium]